MKTLPDNPSLDHLRRQAKDLLAGLRDSDPRASLADAQAALARQYGFRTWTDLKAEVDRRHGRADVADPDVARELAARFDLGEVTAPMRSLSRPDEIGRRWLLETDRGRWAPRTVDDVFPVTDGEENARFQEAALRAGVLLPAPVRSRAGSVVEAVGGNRWRMYEWLHTGTPLAAPVSAATTREVGRILATLHGLRWPAAALCPWSSVRLATASWPDLAAKAGDAPWAPVLAAAVPALTGLQSVAEIPDPPGEPVLCHNNVMPGNVRTGRRLVLTGWEHAAGLPPAWELAFALTHWAVDPDGGINVAGARALIAGYGTAPELSLASFRGAATGLQNYVSGQIETALRAEGAEEVRFTDRNVRHLLTHLPTRETFERLLEAI